jgi:hypothetical protein
MWCRNRFKDGYPTILLEPPIGKGVSKTKVKANVEEAEKRLETVRANSPAPTKYGTFTNPFTGSLKSHDWILLATPFGRKKIF